MGDEKKDYEIWLDEYNQIMNDNGLSIGDITLDLSDYGMADDNTYTISLSDTDWIYPEKPKHDNIVLTGGGEEMLRVEKDGFYVRGVRVEADAQEAEQVYKAFKEWLTWAHLSRREEE
jgi:hypothetical protein